MGQTKEGARKAKEKIILLYGEDFWARTGRSGGKAPHTKPRGFAAHPELASSAGAKGGSAPRKDKHVYYGELKQTVRGGSSRSSHGHS